MPVAVVCLNVALILIFLAAAGVILRRAISTRRIPASVCLFLILPAGQLFMLYSYSFDGWSVYWLLGLLLGMAANVLFLFYAISQEKKTAVLEKLRETQHAMELEKAHYEAVEQRRDELERIRRSFNKKLEAVAEYARSGGDGAAREHISALAEQINRTKEKPYCDIPVINAVLTQKEKECAAAGIKLVAKLHLPVAVAVEPIHLCSILGNMLDNAIAACRKLKGADEPVIRLSCAMDGDYLFIKSANPATKQNINPAPGRGYGRRILSELAKQYDGDFRSDYRDGMYTAVISLTAIERRREV